MSVATAVMRSLLSKVRRPEIQKLANAVVRLVGVTAGKPFPSGDGSLDQKGCVFLPYAQVVPKGRPVGFRNSDPVAHNVHAYDSTNASLFNLATPPGTPPLTRAFEAGGPVRLKCDLHGWMTAWIYVAETPYETVTEGDGSFRLDDVPPGHYRLAVWHELVSGREIAVDLEPRGLAKVALAVSVLGPDSP